MITLQWRNYVAYIFYVGQNTHRNGCILKMLTKISLISKDTVESGSYNFIYTINMKPVRRRKHLLQFLVITPLLNNL